MAKQTIAYRALNKDENTTKYIYYYLLFNKDLLEKGFVGANHKNISKEFISNIKIPIPSLDKQKEIVEYCEYNDNLIKQLEKEIESNKIQAQQFITSIIKSQVQLEEDVIEQVLDELVLSVPKNEIESKQKVKKIVKKVKKSIIEEYNEV